MLKTPTTHLDLALPYIPAEFNLQTDIENEVKLRLTNFQACYLMLNNYKSVQKMFT
jgi:hypothetical protein